MNKLTTGLAAIAIVVILAESIIVYSLISSPQSGISSSSNDNVITTTVPETVSITTTVNQTQSLSLTQTTTTTRTSIETITPVRNLTRPHAAMLTGDRLELELFLNSSRIQVGHGIAIHVNLTNTLPYSNVVAATFPSFGWPLNGLTLVSCSPENPYQEVLPMGIVVFGGYLVPDNVTLGKHLNIVKPGTVSFGCPVVNTFSSLSFEPLRNRALSDPGNQYFSTNATLYLPGYWNGGDSQGNGAVLNRFPQGTYTVVLGDEWGDLLFLYFTSG